MRVDKRMTDMLPKGVLSYAMKLPALKDVRRSLLADFGIPDAVLEHIGAQAEVRRARHRARARGLGHRGAAARQPTPTSCGTTGSATSTPTCSRTARSRTPSTARRWSSPAPRAASAAPRRMKIAAAGGIPILVARSMDKLEEAKAGDRARRRHRLRLLVRPLRLRRRSTRSSRRSSPTTPSIDMLVNNAGRSIRRSVDAVLRPLPRLRAHDPAQLPRHDQADHRAAPAHARAEVRPRRQRLARSASQTNPPRFSAYVASKAALDAFTRVVELETIGDNVTFTTIHMPLVRTPMIAPTKIYD